MLEFSTFPRFLTEFLAPALMSFLSLSPLRFATSRRAFSTSYAAYSNIGKQPITYPTSVTFKHHSLPEGDIDLEVTGPKGSTTVRVENFFELTWEQPSTTPSKPSSSTPAPLSSLSLTVQDASQKIQRSRWGLRRTLIANAVKGLTEGFVIPIKLVGVGYRAQIDDDPDVQNGKRLNMKLGYAHPVYIPIPSDIQVEAPFLTRIILRGTDKQRLGLFAAKIRSWRKPEPYKGKGIFVGDETIKIKAVKKK
ncbi:hypothetical protein FRB99_002847 [Tulasnella sp. 403]|nr:hypothetical protein FRB99_002847 [Tulasnella sp. 403]